MLLWRHHALQHTNCSLPPGLLYMFSPALASAYLLLFEKNSFPSASKGRCSSSFSLDLHQTTQSFNPPIFFDHCCCSDLDTLSNTTTVDPSSSPQNFRSPRPTEWKKGGADNTASPSSLLALMIFCSARSIASDYVGDQLQLLPFPFDPLVFSSITVIRSCSQSRSNHRFREKSQLLLVIVHPGVCAAPCMLRPSVVLILVLSYQGVLPRVAIFLGFRHAIFLDVIVCLDLKTNLCWFLHALLVLVEADGHRQPAVWKALPLHAPFYQCCTILVERISSVKWTGGQPGALHLGIIVFALFQI